MFGFLIAVAAGFLTPQVQATVVPLIAKPLEALNIQEKEHDLLGFMVAMLGAGFLASLFGHSSPFGIAVALVIGYFATRLIAIVQNLISGKSKD